MKIIEEKVVGDERVSLVFTDGQFGILDDESGDCQTYDSESGAREDFNKIKNQDSLFAVFGWENF